MCVIYFQKNVEKIFNKDVSESHLMKINLSAKKKVELLMIFTVDDIKKNIKFMKDTVGYDKIHTKHFMFNSELLNELLSKLFTSFIIHNYVPLDMIRGVITPILKDKLGDCTSSANYRPVMISSVYLKLFEYCLLSKLEPYIKLNDRQHGFRKNNSTSTACFTLKETVMYYMNANSTVFSCFVDIRKAFDSVCHKILFRKLTALGIPTSLINVMRYWYDNQLVQVKYNSSFSLEWKLSNGVRQGGVLSGHLFNIYILIHY